MQAIISLAAFGVIVLGVLILWRFQRQQRTVEDILIGFQQQNYSKHMHQDGSGSAWSDEIPFKEIEPALSPRDRKLLLNKYGKNFTVKFSSWVDTGLAHAGGINATVRQQIELF